jgi:two-component system, NtrC family, response regulator GlrR
MNPTLLLVDDDPGIRRMVPRILREEDFNVLTAETGPEGLALMARQAVDLVLLDLNMPTQNGWDTFERLTADYPLVPVIIVTARSNQWFTAAAAGAAALMEKPLDFPKLIESIKALLREPNEVRLARLAGRQTPFHYSPGHLPGSGEPGGDAGIPIAIGR